VTLAEQLAQAEQWYNDTLSRKIRAEQDLVRAEQQVAQERITFAAADRAYTLALVRVAAGGGGA
jgi:hypothetical protein